MYKKTKEIKIKKKQQNNILKTKKKETKESCNTKTTLHLPLFKKK